MLKRIQLGAYSIFIASTAQSLFFYVIILAGRFIMFFVLCYTEGLKIFQQQQIIIGMSQICGPLRGTFKLQRKFKRNKCFVKKILL